MTAPIRVVVVDDDPMVRTGLGLILGAIVASRSSPRPGTARRR